jgi:type III restriction enzyme
MILLGQIIRRNAINTTNGSAQLLQGVNNAKRFDRNISVNPEDFIAKAVHLINEQKATMVVEHISYDPIDERYDLDIFTKSVTLNSSHKGEQLNRHIYNYVTTDSIIEQQFAAELDVSSEVVVYAQTPKAFYIPTPVGNYNPDWAIAFEANRDKTRLFCCRN